LNICVIGNSHVAALKQSSIQLPYNLDFYAIPGAGAPDLIVKNGKVFPDYESDKGVTYPDLKLGEWVRSNIPDVEKNGLDLNDYDLILYSGVGLPALRTSNKNSLNQVLYYAFLPPDYEKNNSMKCVVSKNCYEKLLFNELECSANICTLRLLLTHFKGKILLQHFPIPTSHLLAQEDFDYLKSKDIPALIKWFYEKQITYIKNIIRGYDNVSYLFDVFELVDDTGLTEHKLGSPKDAWHMNHLYGDAVLNRLQFYLDNLEKKF
tara:strand:+ start:2674 stop:3465 length:792 start_codon:yes stop_codon:yes gene_type:complete